MIPKVGKPGAYFNPNYIDPNKVEDNYRQAGVGTNYGLVQRVNEVHTDPETGQKYKLQSGEALMASGPGTGLYQAGSAARIRTPLLKNPIKESKQEMKRDNSYTMQPQHKSPLPGGGKGSSLSLLGAQLMAPSAGIHTNGSLTIPLRGRHGSNPHGMKSL